jgi:hypothetical protein
MKVNIRQIIPAARPEEKEKRYFHSDYTRNGLAFRRDGEFVFEELYQEPRIIVPASERIKTGAKPRPVVPYSLSPEDIPAVGPVEKIEIVKTRKRRNALSNPGVAQLVQDYITDKLTVHAMTQKYNRSHHTIKKWLEQVGIEERQEAEAVQ